MWRNELTSQAFYQNPDGVFEGWRVEGDVVRRKIPIMGRVWFTTNQAAAAMVLKDNERFGVRGPGGKVAGMQWWMPRTIRRLASSMLSTDEPDHTRLRRKVDGAFRRRGIAEMEPRIRQIADDLLDRMGASFEHTDLLGSFARPFPLAVICELLGLPDNDRAFFMAQAEGLSKIDGIFAFIRAMGGVKRMTHYLEKRIEEIRDTPCEGLISELVHGDDDGEPLSADELLSMVFLLLVAGHETTTHLVTGSVFTLLTHPEQKQWLMADKERVPMAVEEMLRFVSPVQFSKPRFARCDVDFDGRTVEKGQMVMACLAAANLDPAVFDNPNELQLDRKPNPHSSFGSGIHFCLGHQLARLEARIALESLFERYPDLSLAVPAEQISWRSRLGMRALADLPLRAA